MTTTASINLLPKELPQRQAADRLTDSELAELLLTRIRFGKRPVSHVVGCVLSVVKQYRRAVTEEEGFDESGVARETARAVLNVVVESFGAELVCKLMRETAP